MSLRFRDAHKLFEEITQRTTSVRNSIPRLYHATLCNNYAYFEDPVEFSTGKESAISWTSRISALVRNNHPEKAFDVFRKMLVSEQRPNYVTIMSAIRATGALQMEYTSQEVHGLLIKMGFGSEVSVVTALLGVYSIWGFNNVRKLFNQITHKDLVLWSAMISACVKNWHYDEALELFREMQYFGMQPNHVSIVSILPGCANLGALSLGKQIHGFSIRKAVYPHTSVQNSLLDMYAKCKNFEASIRVFNGIESKDLISWKMMIWACIENGYPRKALMILSKVQSLCFELNETLLQDAISACSQAEEVQFGLQLHCNTLKKGFLTFVSIGTALLQMYSKFGRFPSAIHLFNHLHPKDLIAWTAMISVHAQSEHPYNAIDTYRKMQLADERPNEITFVSLLQACSSMGAQELGESIQAYVTKAGYSLNPFISSTLIDFYCKFGRITQGRTLFDDIPTKDLICWSSMVSGYGLNGHGEEALETFLNMLNCGISPNEIVFISVLSACSHCGLEYEGWHWFYSMERIYGITPKLAHYACMVDLLSRRGNIREAFDFVKKMPMEPDKRIWGTILSGCRSGCGGFMDIAEIVADQLIMLDPQNTSYYVILSNLYAEEGRWEKVEKLRQVVDEKGLTKTTGCSMI